MKISINSDGIIDYGDATPFERNVAEAVANYYANTEPYNRSSWITLVERTIWAIRENHKQLKSSIEADYNVYLHKVAIEEVKKVPRSMQMGYVEGYAVAIDDCAEILNQLEDRLSGVLRKHLK